MSKRLRSVLVTAALVLALPAAGAHAFVPAAVQAEEVRVLTLDEALERAEAQNRHLLLARYQLASARSSVTSAPSSAVELAPAVSLIAQAQFGLTIPQGAITSDVAARQAQFSYEDAVAQYDGARQQVRLGTLRAYVEWQQATALVKAYEGALERATAQEANVAAALEAGTVARVELLQAQAQTAGQRAALVGARAGKQAARDALEQVVGGQLAANEVPEQMTVRSANVVVESDLDALVDRALSNRPDLRQAVLGLGARRLQAGLAIGNTGTSVMQIESAATQYHAAILQARAEVGQALLRAESALEELIAREAALGPAEEALRLADLRYDVGLATYLEVQSASAAALQAEAARIQAAANLVVALAQLAQATGDL